MLRFSLLLIIYVELLFGVVVLNDSLKVVDKFSISYLEDPTKELTINEVSKMPFKNRLENSFALGYKEDNLWFKIELENHSQYHEFILYFNEVFFEEMKFYDFIDKRWKEESAGLFTPLNERKIYDIHPAYEFTIKDAQKRTIYIQTYNKMGNFGRFEIFEKNYFYMYEKNSSTILYMLYFGGLIILIILNLFLFFTLKGDIYIYYVGYTSFFFLFILLFSGISFYLGLAPWHYELHFSPSMFILFLILFSREYLNIKEYSIKLYHTFNIFAALSAALVILNFIDIEPWYRVMTESATVVFMLLSFTSIYVWRRGYADAKYYMLALSAYMITIAMLSSLANGYIEYNNVTRYSFLFGSYFEIIFFSLMLANRFNKMQQEQLIFKDRLINIKEENEIALEKKVTQRTDEITMINIQLKDLLKDKELLLKELYHRVKNNFQMLLGLLWFEADKDENSKYSSSLSEISSKIKSMSLIHELLYESSMLSKLDTKEFIVNILTRISAIYVGKNISIKESIESCKLNIDDAMNLSTIINEVISNSIKHHTHNYPCEIEIKLTLVKNIVEVYVSDNGRGFNSSKLENDEGFGLEIIKQFAKKLEKSQINFESNNGTKFTLIFQRGTFD
ncbi:MAG: 7TM diverse intracellular signaling domain-containing protein [Campylobacterota bacterium]|nr:7TM diverse intracellular signaling domain-containing protein [Campylobacterota bacterium]